MTSEHSAASKGKCRSLWHTLLASMRHAEAGLQCLGPQAMVSAWVSMIKIMHNMFMCSTNIYADASAQITKGKSSLSWASATSSGRL